MIYSVGLFMMEKQGRAGTTFWNALKDDNVYVNIASRARSKAVKRYNPSVIDLECFLCCLGGHLGSIGWLAGYTRRRMS